MVEKIFIEWDKIIIAIDILIFEIEASKIKFDGIYAIPRGGLIIGVILSYRLNLPLLLYPTKDTLVVDDISDTGKTLANMKNRKIATLYTTDWTKVEPDFYVYQKQRKNDWIVFPWEDKEEIV